MSRLPCLCGSALAALALFACTDPPAQTRRDTTSVTGIRFLAGGDTKGFTRATSVREFEFPLDHGSHPDYRNEWWYFSGNLLGENGRHFGFELTFFRVALAAAAADRESRWSANQVWLAHFSLTDTDGRRFLADERMSRGAMGLAGANASPFRVWVKDWSAAGNLDEPGGSLWLVAGTPEAGIELEVQGFDRLVAQGDRGLDQKGPEPGNASFYYSAPRLMVQGTVRVGSSSLAIESGFVWMDREWSTSSLSADVAGWDWFALQLSDGSDLMFYRIRRKDGSTTEFSGGTLTDAAGITQRLGANDVELGVSEWWRSPASGTSYPIAWNMRIPSLDLTLRIAPRRADQEVNLSVRYWEGAVEVTGLKGERELGGAGYLELAGY